MEMMVANTCSGFYTFGDFLRQIVCQLGSIIHERIPHSICHAVCLSRYLEPGCTVPQRQL